MWKCEAPVLQLLFCFLEIKAAAAAASESCPITFWTLSVSACGARNRAPGSCTRTCGAIRVRRKACVAVPSAGWAARLNHASVLATWVCSVELGLETAPCARNLRAACDALGPPSPRGCSTQSIRLANSKRQERRVHGHSPVSRKVPCHPIALKLCVLSEDIGRSSCLCSAP